MSHFIRTLCVLLFLPVAAFAQEATDTSTSETMTAEEGVVEMVMGADDAPVTVIEYASFTCPHCARFHEDVFPQLKADYIDTGKVKFIYREVFFDRPGLWGAILARCGGSEKYFGIADLLYKKQAEWSRGADGAAIAASLQTIGKLAGLNQEQIDACFQDRDMALALVENFQKNSEADNVTSTPTLFVNGTNHGNQSYGQLKELLDEALGE